ncbi:hypothetical protein BBJ28_00021990 [Nothophytophthora sp. Chile5]|nr:hypothetical protein BBJ28_00021990 [Nothophytophthora sp. Chile5]
MPSTSLAVARAANRRRSSVAGGAPDGDDGRNDQGGRAVTASPASGGDDDDTYGVVDGPATDIEDAPAAAAPPGYALMPIVPFFEPCFPPLIDSAEWDDDLDAQPWDVEELGRVTLGGITLSQLKGLFPPPPSWIHPARSDGRAPSFNRRLVTVENVRRVYESKPWREPRRLPAPLTFAAGDHAFQELMHVYSVHLKKWAHTYWESTHSLPLKFRTDPYFVQLVADISTRRSRARVNFDRSVLKVVRCLMQNGRSDLDVLLDSTFITFPPARSQFVDARLHIW